MKIIVNFYRRLAKAGLRRSVANRPYGLAGLLLVLNLGMAQTAWAIDFDCATSGGTNCPSASFDNSTIRSTLTVPAGVCPGGIADINVYTDITTTYAADIDMRLMGPRDSSVTLITDKCIDRDDIRATFDNEAPPLVCGFVPAVSGSVKSEGTLSDFYGRSPAGVWKLEVIDDAGGDLTKLNSWTLSIECAQPQLSITATDGAEPSTNGKFTVTISPANKTDAAITGTVTYSGTATNGTDYTAPASFSIPDFSSTATLDFTVTDDNALEGTETVIATISNPSAGIIITAAATANLADDDVAVNYTLAIAKTTDGAEPNTAGRFTVTVSPANATGAAITGTVAYSGTATSGTDYTAPASFSIPNGSSTTTLDFTVTDDTAVEGTETVMATIANPSTGTITTAAATANLADDDVEADHRVSITQASNGAEPNTAGQFTVTVSPANSTGAAITGTVAYSGTATLGTDYTAPTSFSIPNGESSITIPFTVVNDTEVEGTETLIATITLATPAATLKTASTAEALTLGSNSASAVINDDDSGTAIPIFSPFGLLALLGGLFWLGRRFKH